MDRIVYLRLVSFNQAPFLWAVAACDNGWFVWESYDWGKHWIVNCRLETQNEAQKFIDAWCEDYA